MAWGDVAGGRPTKREPTQQDIIVRAIKLGATYLRAAAAAGITYETFRAWRNDDAAFSAAINKAEAARAEQALLAIQRAASDSWQAAAWFLERRYPSEYGRTVQEHTGEQKLTVSIIKRTPSPKEEADS